MTFLEESTTLPSVRRKKYVSKEPQQVLVSSAFSDPIDPRGDETCSRSPYLRHCSINRKPPASTGC